jgi:hypothetical protein
MWSNVVTEGAYAPADATRVYIASPNGTDSTV